jgi:hypothetical protein
MFASYTLAGAMWGLNFGLGGNGGLVHSLFYRFSQAFALIPFINLIYIYKIKSAYLINNWFTYYNSLGVGSGGSVQQDEYMWMFDPTQAVATSPHYYDVAYTNKKLWTAAWVQILIGVVAFYAQPTIENSWKKALEDKAAAEEDVPAEEDAPAEEEPEQEFF